MDESPSRRGQLHCPLCGVASLTARHCKTVCEQCGYVESCEDNFLPNQAHPAERDSWLED